MNSTVEGISGTKKRIVIEATADEVEGEIQKSLRDLSKRTKLPGFRPGKAPVSMIDKKFGKDVEREVLTRLISEYYSSVITDAGLKPLTNPVLEKTDYKRKDDLKFVCSVEVRPTIEGLQYEGLPREEVDIKVEDDEIETNIQALLRSKGTYEPTDKPVELDHLITIDYDVIEDNKTYTDQYLRVGDNSFPEDFFNSLIDKKKGDEVEIKTNFPEDFTNDDLKGRILNLKVRIKDIKEFSLPELDDEFAKDVGLNSLEELREKIREGIDINKRETAIKEQKSKMIKSLVKKYDFEIPDIALKSEIEYIIQNAKRAEQYKDKTDEQLKEKFKNDAIEGVKTMIILDTIGEKENISVSNDEVNERLKMYAQAMSMTPEALTQFYHTQNGSIEGIRYSIFREKVVDSIYSKSTMNPVK